jgi:hypothetical protein
MNFDNEFLSKQVKHLLYDIAVLIESIENTLVSEGFMYIERTSVILYLVTAL